ncbi:tyrosine-protein phosphatase [Mucilaginibacter sp. KACC 22063]|uniref:tyrosine-protein phosphatase n=1 Tax=Mucilaginibacter sp. KACC 22063 TaxID=3025666 RepID=UPI002365607B|nr:CpsB/CapC family capsule biosynthesis tyrosine phosphatase [Mucilaginibacter sp. KACC 22063]WDF56320.1 capsular biosynthesis protein [Mucilaginibacter sp. KACC 22063]
MFGFFKKKEKKEVGEIEFDYSEIVVDMHSHVLPGIDDGAETVEDSIVLIRKMMELGIKKIIATPHVMIDYYRNTPESVNGALNLLKEKLKQEQISIDVFAAAEHYFDESFEDRIANRQFLTMGDDYVLFELSFANKPPNVIEIIQKMTVAGYKPILAHPERYSYLSIEEAANIREWGCLLQLNTISLTGYYGAHIKQAAEKLIDAGLVDLISSDMHHPRHAHAFEKALREPYFKKLVKSGVLKNKTLFEL